MSVLLPLLAVLVSVGTEIEVVDQVPHSPANQFYLGNQEPLAQSTFVRLPVGAIEPKGWVREQLVREANGFVGNLKEISPWLKRENNAWLSPTGEGVNGWEEVPYWLKGFTSLAYVLKDPKLIEESKFWLDAYIAGQRENGYLGPNSNLVSSDGKPDVWPNMPMLYALRTYYDATKQEKILDALERYFKWELALPDSSLFLSYWEQHRGGDNMEIVFWLYNVRKQQGKELSWLLDLARKIHRKNADWVSGVPNLHGVNFAQAFREPAQFSQLSLEDDELKATEKDWNFMRGEFGQMPGGMYGADENARSGRRDPRQATETCAMVEAMYSHELLLTQTGDSIWADRCEDVTFNSLPASMGSDEKTLRYLTSANMPLSDARSKNPGLENSGPMQLMNPWDHRCCQHNVAQGWPYYAEHLWLGTANNGLAVALYAPSVVTAKVGADQTATITESTDYPFRDTVNFSFSVSSPSKFPFVLRIPAWCPIPQLKVNNKSYRLDRQGHYIVITREWQTGDTVSFRMPMKVQLKTWKVQGGAVSVERGPLCYSLQIGEKWNKVGGSDRWPAYEIKPTTPWNYGISYLRFSVVEEPMTDQPFGDKPPIKIQARGRKIPEWQLDYLGLVPELQASPAKTKEAEEEITLVPMGSQRLRISVFPTAVTRGGNIWKAPSIPQPSLPAKASHCYSGDTVDALTDGMVPKNSGDESIPRMTWWPQKGTEEWVEITLPKETLISRLSVYWFDDRDKGGCRVPESWGTELLENGKWVSGGSKLDGVLNDWDSIDLVAPKKVTKIRVKAMLKRDYSGGILEVRWK